MLNLSLRQRGQILGTALLLSFAIALVATLAFMRAVAQHTLVDDQKYTSYLLADELRQSSDDLTRLARTYVLTADARYETQYNRILAIRNGEEERPLNYNRIYWDFVAAGRPVATGSGVKIPLREMMRQAGFTDEEFAYLDEAQANSDGLVSLELRAMNAVKGRFADASGAYTITGEPDMTLAAELLHSPEYHGFKADIMAPMDKFFTAMEERFEVELAARDAALGLYRGLLWVSVGMLAALTTLTLWQTATRVLAPIAKLSDTMRRLGEGEDIATIPCTDKTDEIGQMARQTEVYKARADEALQLSKDLAEQSKKTDRLLEENRASAEEAKDQAARLQEAAVASAQAAEHANEFQTSVDALIGRATNGELDARIEVNRAYDVSVKVGGGINALMELIDSTLRDVSKALGRIAQGDLSTVSATDYPGAFGELTRQTERARQQLAELVSETRDATDFVQGGTSELSAAISDLAQRTESASMMLEQSSNGLTDLASAIQGTADEAGAANEVMRAASDKVHKSETVVSKAVDTMGEIENSSRSIRKIIDLIDDIAFQTNLLALNAGVEAARAGDAGRGFAVVASEVRGLAQRSSDAAKEINTLISHSVSEIKTGAEQVNLAGRSLQEIVALISEVSTNVESIAGRAQDQAAGVGELNGNVDRLQSTTQQNAAMTEEANAATIQLADQATKLQSKMEEFRLDATGTHAAGAMRISA